MSSTSRRVYPGGAAARRGSTPSLVDAGLAPHAFAFLALLPQPGKLTAALLQDVMADSLAQQFRQAVDLCQDHLVLLDRFAEDNPAINHARTGKEKVQGIPRPMLVIVKPPVKDAGVEIVGKESLESRVLD